MTLNKALDTSPYTRHNQNRRKLEIEVLITALCNTLSTHTEYFDKAYVRKHITVNF